MSFKRLLPVLATAALACGSETPSEPNSADRPVILQFYGPPGNVSPGDTVTFNFVLRDSTLGKKYLTLRFDGALSHVYAFELDMDTFVWSGYVWVKLPAEAEPLKTTIATFIFTNEAGLSHQKTFSMPIWDIRRPEATLSFGGLRNDGTIGTGQALDLQITASDNHRLTYLGYSGGGLRDSVPATGAGDSHVFRVTVPAWWTEPRPLITVWARDASGNRSDVAGVSAPVFDWSDNPKVTVPFTAEPLLGGVLWDAKRQVAYLLRGKRIEVVHPTGTLGTPIIFAHVPFAMALTESGDSLVVTFPDEKALGVVDLLPAVRSASVVPLTYQNEVGKERWPRSVLVSGSHVFVTLVHSLYSAHLLDVNLGDATQTIRTDFDDLGLDGDPGLFRLTDGRIYLASQARSYSDARYLYSPATNRFMRNYALREAVESSFSTALSGRFMVANTVYEPSLDTYRVIETQDWKEDMSWMPAAALSQDGLSVFLGTHYGIARFNLNSTLPSKQIRLETWTRFLLATPDGNTLIAVGGLPFSARNEQAVTFIDIR
jgi:hypothetical protein